MGEIDMRKGVNIGYENQEFSHKFLPILRMEYRYISKAK